MLSSSRCCISIVGGMPPSTLTLQSLCPLSTPVSSSNPSRKHSSYMQSSFPVLNHILIIMIQLRVGVYLLRVTPSTSSHVGTRLSYINLMCKTIVMCTYLNCSLAVGKVSESERCNSQILNLPPPPKLAISGNTKILNLVVLTEYALCLLPICAITSSYHGSERFDYLAVAGTNRDPP